LSRGGRPKPAKTYGKKEEHRQNSCDLTQKCRLHSGPWSEVGVAANV